MTASGEEWTGPWDLVVVGHGAAGLSAAASFLERFEGGQPRVAVLDRAPFEERGGSTAWTSANFRLDDDGQLDPAWGKIVTETAGDEVNAGYVDTFYENCVDTLNWLRQNGVRTLTIRNAALPGMFSRHGYALQGGGRAFVEVFTELVQARGAQCFYEMDLVGLDREPGGPVTGVHARAADGSERHFAARAVVLACGGFEGDRQKLGQRFPGGETLDTVSRGTRVNTGRGIDAAVAIGAATAGDFSGSHLEPVDPRSEVTEPLVSSWFWGILVDPEGKRFMDEAATSFDMQFDFVAKEILARGGRAYAINDASVRSGNPYFEFLNATDVGPITADSIEELAEKLGLDAAALRQTVDEYNAASVDAPYDATALDNKHTVGIAPPKSHWAQPLTQAPFEAWPVGAQICFTFWGLKVDGTTHVLDTADRPIDGLHAAGEITGIFHGNVYPSGSSVLRSLTFGRIAGQEAAQALKAAALA